MGMTVSEVRGPRPAEGATKRSIAGMEYQVDLLPKIKIEMVVAGHGAAPMK